MASFHSGVSVLENEKQQEELSAEFPLGHGRHLILGLLWGLIPGYGQYLVASNRKYGPTRASRYGSWCGLSLEFGVIGGVLSLASSLAIGGPLTCAESPTYSDTVCNFSPFMLLPWLAGLILIFIGCIIWSVARQDYIRRVTATERTILRVLKARRADEH